MANVEKLLDDIPASVQDALGAAEGALDTADPIVIVRSLRHALTRAVFRPQATVPAFARFGERLVTGGIDVAVRALGSRMQDPVAVVGKDAGFRDPAWAQNPLFRGGWSGISPPPSCCSSWSRPAISTTRPHPRPCSPRVWSPTPCRPTCCSPTRPRRSADSRPAGSASCAAVATSCSTSSRTTAGRARSTAHRSRWARTRLPLPARSCSATSSSRSSSTRRRPTTSTRSRCSCARRGSTGTTSWISRRRRA